MIKVIDYRKVYRLGEKCVKVTCVTKPYTAGYGDKVKLSERVVFLTEEGDQEEMPFNKFLSIATVSNKPFFILNPAFGYEIKKDSIGMYWCGYTDTVLGKNFVPVTDRNGNPLRLITPAYREERRDVPVVSYPEGAKEIDCGFLDQNGNFHNKKDALIIAKVNGQFNLDNVKSRPLDKLNIEDLYNG